MKTLFLVVGIVLAAGLAYWMTLRMLKLKKVHPRVPAMLLNVLTCLFITEIAVIVNETTHLESWMWTNWVIVAVVWFIYMCGKHLKTKQK